MRIRGDFHVHPRVLGGRAFAQAVVIDPTAPVSSLAFTNGVQIKPGE